MDVLRRFIDGIVEGGGWMIHHRGNGILALEPLTFGISF